MGVTSRALALSFTLTLTLTLNLTLALTLTLTLTLNLTLALTAPPGDAVRGDQEDRLQVAGALLGGDEGDLRRALQGKVPRRRRAASRYGQGA